MSAVPIVIEERLRTPRLSGALSLAMLAELLRGRGAVKRYRSKVRVVIASLRLLFAESLMLLLVVMAQRVVVRVCEAEDGRCLEVLYGPGGLWRQVFRADEIVSAEVRDVSLMRMGGWGYRGSLRLMGWAALVTRPGNALALELTGGRRFMVTVDEPEAFASALSHSIT